MGIIIPPAVAIGAAPEAVLASKAAAAGVTEEDEDEQPFPFALTGGVRRSELMVMGDVLGGGETVGGGGGVMAGHTIGPPSSFFGELNAMSLNLGPPPAEEGYKARISAETSFISDNLTSNSSHQSRLPPRLRSL